MSRILITGANRGIGLEMVRQYLQQPENHVIAACRDPEQADMLQHLARSHPHNLSVIPLDVSDSPSIESAAATVADLVKGLDILINNAGTNPRDAGAKVFGLLDAALIQDVIHVNATGALIVSQAFLPLLQAGNQPRIVMVSSQMGSLGRENSGRSYAYRMSKAAMNMAARTLAMDLHPQNIIVVTLHPGWVKTDMGGSEADIATTESASGIITLTERLTLADTGKFYKWDGSEHIW